MVVRDKVRLEIFLPITNTLHSIIRITVDIYWSSQMICWPTIGLINCYFLLIYNDKEKHDLFISELFHPFTRKNLYVIWSSQLLQTFIHTCITNCQARYILLAWKLSCSSPYVMSRVLCYAPKDTSLKWEISFLSKIESSSHRTSNRDRIFSWNLEISLTSKILRVLFCSRVYLISGAYHKTTLRMINMNKGSKRNMIFLKWIERSWLIITYYF